MMPIKIKKNLTILTVMVFAFTPLTGLAADMWQETPDLNDDTETSITFIKPVVFTNTRPLVDKWAETPDLNAELETYNFILDYEVRFLNTLIPEMYSETPTIDNISPTRKPVSHEDTFLAEGR